MQTLLGTLQHEFHQFLTIIFFTHKQRALKQYLVIKLLSM